MRRTAYILVALILIGVSLTFAAHTKTRGFDAASASISSEALLQHIKGVLLAILLFRLYFVSRIAAFILD